jgi:hypothetical protein
LETGPAFGQSVPSSAHAIFIDLDQKQADLPYGQLQPITSFLTNTLSPEEIIVDPEADREGELCVGAASAEGATQPAQVDSPLGVDIRAEPVGGIVSLVPLACAVEAECSDSGVIPPAETVDLVVGDPQEIISASAVSSADIRGPPRADVSSSAEQHKGLVVFVDPLLAESEALRAGLRSGSELGTRVIYLDPDRDGV